MQNCVRPTAAQAFRATLGTTPWQLHAAESLMCFLAWAQWRGIDQRGGGDPAQLINEMIGFAPEKRESARTT